VSHFESVNEKSVQCNKLNSLIQQFTSVNKFVLGGVEQLRIIQVCMLYSNFYGILCHDSVCISRGCCEELHR